MLQRRTYSIALLVIASIGLHAPTASADMCNLTGVNSVCGPTADSTTMVITQSSGTYQSMVGTYSGPGWAGANQPAPGSPIYDSGAIFAQINVQPTGTGVIQSFLRLQNNPNEQGYNTDARSYAAGKTQFDEKTDPNFTRSIQLGAVPIVNIGGTNYREFFLDINENASLGGRLLSLDQLEIFLSSSSTLDNYASANPNGPPSSLTGLGGATSKQIFTLDTGFNPSSPDSPFVDNWISLDYLTSSGGSGKGDMVFYLPDALFANSGQGTNPYVYLYSQFGCGGVNKNCNNSSNNYSSDDISQAGFEEWWVRSVISGGGGGSGQSSAVPEPTTLILLGTGLLIVARRYRAPSAKLVKLTKL